jgi:cytoskeletal protein CcmA (bactofilin family)
MAFKDLIGRQETGEATTREPTQAPRVTTPSRPPTPTGSTTFLDSSTVFEGKLTCADSLRIDGQVKGEIYCAQKVAIGETGSVHATIEADTVVVAGEVNGDITATRKVTLEKTGRVNGNLCTPGIVIQEGAKLEGRITIGEDVEPEAKAAPKAEPAKPAAKDAAKETAAPPATTPGH